MSRNRRGKKKNKSSAIGCRKGRVWIVFGTCLGVMSAIMVRGCHLYTYTHAHLTCVTHSRTLRKTHTYTHSHYAHIYTHPHTIIAFTHISNDKHIQTYTHTYTHTLQTHIQHTYIQALLHTHTLVHIHTSTHAHNTNTIPLSKFIFLALVIFT